MKQARILIADDEQATCKYIDKQLKMEASINVSVDFAYDRDAAIAQLDENPPYDLILVDLWMPDAQGILDREAGLKVLKRSKQQSPIPQAVVITANSSSETALEASGLGIHDYISKPINYSRLIEVVKEVLSQRSEELPGSDDSIAPADDFEIIGKSPVMIEVMTTVGRVARSETDVLLYGESGTGKDFVARAIHKHSPRREGPFEVVNCSAIPAELIEAELFGIGRRVATSVDQRPGKFQQAHGGTILLDEIGDLSLEMQPKLLRVLDYKEIQGVGVRVQRVDVRIIAATNRDLGAAVAEGKFRSDLYYRLKPIIALPPLREREGDIGLLAWHFLRKYSHALEQQGPIGFDDAVLAAFEGYNWPGNVRQLRNLLQRLVVTTPAAVILPEHLPGPLGELADGPGQFSMALGSSLQEVEAELIRQTLQRLTGNRREAAAILGISVRSIQYKINQYNITNK